MTMPVQSVLFNKKYWSQAKAIEWLKKQGYVNNGVHETQNYYRYRQFDPEPRREYRAVPVPTKNIILIVDI